MTLTESRTLGASALVVVAAALLRAGCFEASPPEPPVSAAASDDVSARLLAESERRLAEEARRRAPLAPEERIDPNRAPAVELDRLPGVGPAVAGAIVESRAATGAFRAPDDLLRVPGLGAKTLDRIRPHLRLPDPIGGAADRISLGRATAAELEGLPGIGPVLARRIVELRKRRGGFGDVRDLLDVRGIGPATLERIGDRLRLR